MKRPYVLLAFIAGIAPTAQATCSSPVVVEMRTTSPLKAAEPDASFIVRVHQNGCLESHRPHYDTQAGTLQGHLDSKSLISLQSQIRASGVALIRPEELRSELDAEQAQKGQQPGAKTLWRVSDGDLIELRVPANEKLEQAKTIRWRTLDDDLLNHPDHPQLLAIRAVQQLILEVQDKAVAREATR